MLGLIDPARGMLWAAALLLPSFVHTLRIAAVGAWFMTMFFPIVHATFGGHIGGITRWLMTRGKRSHERPTYSVRRIALVVLSLVAIAGLDPYVSLIYGGGLRLHDTRWRRLITGAVGTIIGLLFGGRLFVATRGHVRDRRAAISDDRGVMEWVAWGALFFVVGARRIVFEGCFAIVSRDFTRCLDAADYPALFVLGAAIGLVAGVHRRAADEESILQSPVMVELSPWRAANRVAAGATLIFACFNMGIGSWDNLEPPKKAPVVLNRVAFVAIGEFPEQQVRDLAVHYRRSFGLTVDVLPDVPLERQALRYQREQLIAEKLVELIQRRQPRIARDRNVLVVGFTTNDMYSCHLIAYGFPYCDIYQEYALDAEVDGRFAVISTSRLDPSRYGQPRDEQLLGARLRKLTSRAIGHLYYHYPASNDPHSALFAASRPEQLDAMSDDFHPHR